MRKQLTDKSLVHRHTDKRRNVIINRCSTDLEKSINGHDPETGNLNNDVWDRLDKMALEIEAHLASREAQQAATPTAQEPVPVAYQVRMSDGRWGTIFHHPDKPLGDHRPLYAHPSQPSASVVEALITEPGAPPPRHLFTTRPQATEQTP